MQRIQEAIKQVCPKTRAKILKHKKAGLPLDVISAKVTLPLVVVSGVIHHHILREAKKK